MRMMKKVLGTVTVLALSVSLLAGCGSTAASPVSSAASTAAESTTSSVVSETTSAAADENVAAAAQLLNDLTGSYQELWPVILADEYSRHGWMIVPPLWERKMRKLPLKSSLQWLRAMSTARMPSRPMPTAAELFLRLYQ